MAKGKASAVEIGVLRRDVTTMRITCERLEVFDVVRFPRLWYKEDAEWHAENVAMRQCDAYWYVLNAKTNEIEQRRCAEDGWQPLCAYFGDYIYQTQLCGKHAEQVHGIFH